MKKLVSLFLIICFIFSTFAFISAQAQDNNIVYIKNAPCYKLYDVYKFTQENFNSELSDYKGDLTVNDDGSLTIKTNSDYEKMDLYFNVEDLSAFLLNESAVCNYELYFNAFLKTEGEYSYSQFINITFKTEDSEQLGHKKELSFKVEELNPYYDPNGIIATNHESKFVTELNQIHIAIYNEDEDQKNEEHIIDILPLKCRYGVQEHEIVTVDKKEGNCIQAGSTGRQYCDVCKEYFTLNWATAPNFNNHKSVQELKAVNPSCTTDGLTAGEYCDACKKEFIKQETVKATGHSAKWSVKKEATYFKNGSKILKCETCREIIKTKSTAKKKLGTPSVKYIKSKGKFTVKYTKVKDATGFMVRYKKENGNWKSKVFNINKSVSKVIKNLKKGNYKVQTRAFVKSGNKTAYSSWTDKKTVKVK